MTLFHLYTNEHPDGEIVRSTKARLRRAMWAYIREKRSRGFGLGDVLFCWRPVRVDRVV